jgi:hypothetical protein
MPAVWQQQQFTENMQKNNSRKRIFFFVAAIHIATAADTIG